MQSLAADVIMKYFGDNEALSYFYQHVEVDITYLAETISSDKVVFEAFGSSVMKYQFGK